MNFVLVAISRRTFVLVKGGYEYCHYLYDGTDDRGWGCGYRTLQTIISWIQHNINSTVTVPSIRKIQETLVEVKELQGIALHSSKLCIPIPYCQCLDLKLNAFIVNIISRLALPPNNVILHMYSWKTSPEALLVPKSGLEVWR